MNNSVIQKIENVLSSEYSVKNFVEFVQEVFDNVKLIAPDHIRKEFSNFSSHIAGSSHVGEFITPDKKKVIIFSVELLNQGYVENSRSTQRSYAKKIIENSGCDAALVAFYKSGDPKWRLSFVRLDYEMKIENGKLKTAENMTPAKRYSYLVGEGEPCHTAKERFLNIIEDNHSRPTLGEIEEAFSVEAVTNEFFALYCEKFHQLRECLEDNENFRIESEHHNFTAAQFAKKLMGQIVFLYFLQKKGWLGVNAWPKTMTEKEHKKAFFARGAKSRELIPLVYKHGKDGLFYLYLEGLEKLNDDDEALLASCVKGEPWGTGPQDFMRRLFIFSQKKNANFFEAYLEPLFYNALNVNRGEQGYDPVLHCRIPFLSGGLFEPIDGYEWEHNDFGIPNEIFSNGDTRTGDGILDIFDRYNFTMCEDEPLEREVAIDPEMLGKVFENLLEVNDRKSKGAFYTPREIVHYMCQECLINYLTEALNVSEDAVRDFILYGDFMKDEDTVKEKRLGNKGMYISEELYKIDEEGKVAVNRLMDMDRALSNVRVADPAVGSGAFPLGMLNEIVRARQNISAYMSITMEPNDIHSMYHMERSPYRLKYETIKNCIYAVDIEPSAVDIAQLRLWLALVIDDETNAKAESPLDGHRNPLPLPNLECNILCGNSLVDEFEGVHLINESELIGNDPKYCQLDISGLKFEKILTQMIEKQSELFNCDNTEKKRQLIEEIEALKDRIIRVQLEGCFSDTIQNYEDTKQMASKPYILWQLEFARVFREKGGFDIVIGNPPYVDSEEMTKSMPEQREIYTNKFKCAKGNWDLFVVFIEKGMNLLFSKGIISYIVPNKLISAPYTVALRKEMAQKHIIEMRDYSNVTVFKSAAVYPVVFRISMESKRSDVIMDVMNDMNSVKNHNIISSEKFYQDIDWDKYFSSSPKELTIIDKMMRFPALDSIATVNGAATVSEAYLVKDYIYDSNGIKEDHKKFINTGGIDRYKSFYGQEYMRYLKGKYLFPTVRTTDLSQMSQKRFIESNSEKIIIGGMNKILECYYDKGEYLAGKSTTIVYQSKNLKYITAVLNSRLMTFFYKIFFNSMSLAGGFYRVGAPQIKILPIAIPKDCCVLNKIESLVDEIQKKMLDLSEPDAIVVNCLQEIDSEIYKVYGLTEEEVAIIENQQQ